MHNNKMNNTNSANVLFYKKSVIYSTCNAVLKEMRKHTSSAAVRPTYIFGSRNSNFASRV